LAPVFLIFSKKIKKQPIKHYFISPPEAAKYFYKTPIPVQHAALFLFPAPYLSERVQDLLAVSKSACYLSFFSCAAR
jgi:hypothetical protein